MPKEACLASCQSPVCSILKVLTPTGSDCKGVLLRRRICASPAGERLQDRKELDRCGSCVCVCTCVSLISTGVQIQRWNINIDTISMEYMALPTNGEGMFPTPQERESTATSCAIGYVHTRTAQPNSIGAERNSTTAMTKTTGTHLRLRIMSMMQKRAQGSVLLDYRMIPLQFSIGASGIHTIKTDSLVCVKTCSCRRAVQQQRTTRWYMYRFLHSFPFQAMPCRAVPRCAVF